MKSVKKSVSKASDPRERSIDVPVRDRADWREKMLNRIRALIEKADPEAKEELKWRGVPVWSHDGMICTAETYKSVVKMTFAQGASLKDPSGLFNSSLDGNTRRAIDISESTKVNEKALNALIRAAVAFNQAKAKTKVQAKVKRRAKPGVSLKGKTDKAKS